VKILQRVVNGSIVLTMGMALVASVGQAEVDSKPPTIQLMRPVNNQVMLESFTAYISGTDNVGIDRVEYWLDGDNNVLVGKSTAKPSFPFRVDLTKIPRGFHTLGAKAFDAAGNAAFNYAVFYAYEGPSYGCSDLMVQVNNATASQVIGYMGGSGLGSSGFVAAGRSTSYTNVWAGRSTVPYAFEAHIQVVNGVYLPTELVCKASLPLYNGCPRPYAGSAIVTIVENGCAITLK
jgi:hypothetical protein